MLFCEHSAKCRWCDVAVLGVVFSPFFFFTSGWNALSSHSVWDLPHLGWIAFPYCLEWFILWCRKKIEHICHWQRRSLYFCWESVKKQNSINGVFLEGRGVGEGTDNILGWVLLQFGVLLLKSEHANLHCVTNELHLRDSSLLATGLPPEQGSDLNPKTFRM